MLQSQRMYPNFRNCLLLLLQHECDRRQRADTSAEQAARHATDGEHYRRRSETASVQPPNIYEAALIDQC